MPDSLPKGVLRRSRYLWLSPQLWKRRLLFWCGAIGVGAAAVGFAVGAEYAIEIFHRLLAIAPWLPFLITPAGLALVVWLTRRFAPGSEGSGIPQTIAAMNLRSPSARKRLLSWRIALGKVLLTLLGLVSGASVGREGPTVQIGASIMHSLGNLVRFPRHEMEKGLILAGGAAGVAAAFNTPLAGIVFAIEELSRSFEQRTSGTVLTAVIIAGILALAALGNYVYFGHTPATLEISRDWIAVAVCGVSGGLLGGLFSRALIASGHGLPGRLGRWSTRRPVRFAAGCGLVLAAIGVLSGNTTFGTGYLEAKQILEGADSMPETYGILKLLATYVSYLSGIPGGIFSPSLSIGAGFGMNLANWMPYAPSDAVIILGMVGYFAGVVQAPITAFVIVMEMTDNHSMVLPLMTTAFIAYGSSRLVCPKSLYSALAEGFLQRAQRVGDRPSSSPASQKEN